MLVRPLALAAIGCLLLATAVSAAEPLAHTKDSLETVKKNVEAGKAVIVDVREQKEWDEAHVKGAILAPKSKLVVEGELAKLMKAIPKDKVIYTHCKAGGRALACGEILKQHGYDVRPLKPGIQALLEAGFEPGKKD